MNVNIEVFQVSLSRPDLTVELCRSSAWLSEDEVIDNDIGERSTRLALISIAAINAAGACM